MGIKNMSEVVKNMMNNVSEILNNEDKFNVLCRKAFDEIDTDSSGQLSITELRTAIRSLAKEALIENPSDELVNGVFTMLDTDKNGEISYLEFSAGVKVMLTTMLKN